MICEEEHPLTSAIQYGGCRASIKHLFLIQTWCFTLFFHSAPQQQSATCTVSPFIFCHAPHVQLQALSVI